MDQVARVILTVNGSSVVLQQAAYAKWAHLAGTVKARDFLIQQRDLSPTIGCQAARHYRSH